MADAEREAKAAELKAKAAAEKKDEDKKEEEEKVEEEKEEKPAMVIPESEEEPEPIDFEGVDVFGANDILDVGNGTPLFKDFQHEDFVMMALRAELNLIMQ